MGEQKKNNEESFNFMSDVFGGQFLSKMKMTGQWLFILYVFFLIIIYISINLGVARTQLTQRRNQREIKNLKADYTSKTAKLQYQSKQGEIELRLKAAGSKVEKPKHPARLVKEIEQ
ncbi:MAG: hypothetical protein IJA38_06120 [Bacteroidales bacterium]|nr:hypothetical protein [Bacteroidales bacterium]